MSALALLACTAVASGPTADLAKARDLFAQLKYAEAAKALQAAEAAGGTDLEDTLQLYELSGVLAGTLKQPDKARAAFRVLLTLDPNHALVGSWPPRVKTPFFEAKGEVEQGGPFAVEAAAESTGEIAVRLKHDPLKLATAVRVHVRKGDGPWSTDSRAAAPELRFAAGAAAFEWWLEVVGAKQMVIARVGTADAPRREQPLPLPPVATATTDAPALVAAPAGEVKTAPPASDSRPLWRASAVLAAIAVASGAGAIAFGVRSDIERRQLTNPMLDAMGIVVGMTRAQALELNQRMRTEAIVANVLIGTAAAFGVTAAVCFLIGAL